MDAKQRNRISGVAGIGALIGASLFGGGEAKAAGNQPGPEGQRAGQRYTGTDREIQKIGVVHYVDSVEDVVRLWEPGKQLFIKRSPDGSEPNITAEQEQMLADYLTEHSNWVIYIADQAEGEYYNGAKGVSRHLTAVQDHLGFELRKKPGWDSNVGNIIISTFDGDNSSNPYRRTRLLAGDEYDRVGLGEKQWKPEDGNLQDLAVSRLADGLRVYDAMVNTVGTIDRRFNEKLEAERKQLERTKTSATMAVAGAGQALEGLEATVAAFNQNYPGRSGGLANPDFDGLRDALTTATDALEDKDYPKANRTASTLRDEIDNHERLIAEYPSAGETLESLKREIAKAADNEFLFLTRDQYARAEQAIEDAGVAYNKGVFNYNAPLDTAKQAMQLLERELSNAAEQYREDGAKIRTIEGKLKTLGESPHASAADRELRDATQLVELTRTEWKQKRSSYIKSLDNLELLHDTAEKMVADATAAEQSRIETRNNYIKAFGFGVAAMLLGATFFARQARRRRKEVQEKLDGVKSSWKEKEKGLTALEVLKEKALNEKGVPVKFAPGSETESKAKEARAASARLRAFQVIARVEIIGQVEELMNPSSAGGRALNIVSRSNYNKAMDLLTKAPITFSEENREMVKRAFKEHKVGTDVLLEDFEKLEGFSRTVKEVQSEYNELAAVATGNLKSILEARKEVKSEIALAGTALKELKSAASSVEELVAKDKTHPQLFAVPQVKGKFAPDMEKALSQATQDCGGDPVGVRKEVERLSSLIEGLKGLTAEVAKKRSATMTTLEQGTKALNSKKLQSGWILNELTNISGRTSNTVASYAAAVEDKKATEPKFDLVRRLKDWTDRVEKAVALTEKYAGASAKSITNAEKLVGSTRTDLGKKLGIDAEKILSEEGSNPDTYIATMKKRHNDFKTALDKGDLKAAQKCSEDIAAAAASVDSIINETNTAFEKHAEILEDRRDRAEDLRTTIPVINKRLNAMVASYADTALKLTAEDTTFARGNGTVADNIEEAQKARNNGIAATDRAEQIFKEGKILEASFEFVRGNDFFTVCQHRLNEVTAKEERINTYEAENVRRIAELDKQEARIRKAITAKEVSQDTIDMFSDKPTKAYNRVHTVQETEPRDPFKVSDLITNATARLQGVEKAIKRDHDEYDEVVRSAKTALQNLQQADRTALKLDKNDIPDSRVANEAEGQIDVLEAQYRNLKSDFNQAKHEDWSHFDREFDRISVAAKRNLKTLEEEDKIGRETRQGLKEAAADVRRADTWSGSYGITVSGDFGEYEMKQAKRAYQQGNFGSAKDWYERASSASSSAISRAQSEVRAERDRRAAARAAEEAAAAAAQAALNATLNSVVNSVSTTTTWGGGGISSGFSGGGSFGGSSGFSGGGGGY